MAKRVQRIRSVLPYSFILRLSVSCRFASLLSAFASLLSGFASLLSGFASLLSAFVSLLSGFGLGFSEVKAPRSSIDHSIFWICSRHCMALVCVAVEEMGLEAWRAFGKGVEALRAV